MHFLIHNMRTLYIPTQLRMSLSSPFPMVFGNPLALAASTSSRTMALEINIWVENGAGMSGGTFHLYWGIQNLNLKHWALSLPLRFDGKVVQFEWRELPSQAKMEQNRTNASSDEDLPSDRQRKPMHPKPKPPALVHRILVDNGEHDMVCPSEKYKLVSLYLKYIYIKQVVFIHAPLILRCFLGSGDFFSDWMKGHLCLSIVNSLPTPSCHVAGLTQSTGAWWEKSCTIGDVQKPWK